MLYCVSDHGRANLPDEIQALGIFGQSLYIDPRDRLVVVVLSAWPQPTWEAGYRAERSYIAGVHQALRDQQTSKGQ